MNIKILWDFNLHGNTPNPNDTEAHDKFAQEQGIPIIVDLNDFFEDPASVGTYQITDALSDQFGWLVYDWEVINECNNDNNNNIINHQPQPINPEEDHMDNSNTLTLDSKEESMNSQDIIIELFNRFIEDEGSPKVTAFKRHLEQLTKLHIKPLCVSSAKSADGSDWRSQLKTRFSGRGAKWVLVPLAEISGTIARLVDEGINCDDYKTFIEQKGEAWIRFAGPRLDPNGKQAAAFEVRTGGSKIDHPNQLHLIELTRLNETITPLTGTPHAMNFELLVENNKEIKDDNDQ